MMELIKKAVEAPYKPNDCTKIVNPLLRKALRYYPHTCYNCGKDIPYFNPKIRHVNIAQDPSVKLFCSKECRNKWIFSAGRINNNPALYDLITNKPNEVINYRQNRNRT